MRVGRQPTGDPNHLVVPSPTTSMFQCPSSTWRTPGRHIHRRRSCAAARCICSKAASSGPTIRGATLRSRTGKTRSAACCRRLTTRFATSRRTIRFHDDVPDPAHAADSVDQPLAAQRRRHLRARASSDVVVVRGISDRDGQLMVLMTHNTDISDAWEREGEDPQYFYTSRQTATRSATRRTP